ncbi:MAG TPA: LysR family transcriptional regulator [Rhodoblastus sp.]|nr:LysR family transcriptional regulator [Rhodoblastus sp.]
MSKGVNTPSLLAFLAVAEEGSINAAAERLHVSQPALTRTVRELEEHLGLPLFERNHKGVRLTGLGERVLVHARRIRAELETLGRSVASYRQRLRGHMTIGAAPVHPVSLVSRAIAEFQKTHDIEIEIVIGSQIDMIAALRRGDVDLFLGPLAARGENADLLQEHINFEDTQFYCRGGHPLSTRIAVDADDLADTSWVLGARGTTLRTQIESHFAQRDLALDVLVETEDVNVRRSLVAQSDLVSAFQTHHVFNELRTGALARIDYPVLQDKQSIGCIRTTPHTAESRFFVDLLIENYKAAGLA